jgi:hypothetical protein
MAVPAAYEEDLVRETEFYSLVAPHDLAQVGPMVRNAMQRTFETTPFPRDPGRLNWIVRHGPGRIEELEAVLRTRAHRMASRFHKWLIKWRGSR